MITTADLPKAEGAVVLELDDGAMLKIEMREPDLFYGQSDSFDVEEHGAMMVAKLNLWGARVIGWE